MAVTRSERDRAEAWASSVRATLAEMASQDFGYPVGVNEVRERAAERHGVPLSLEPLYAAFDGLSLPDVHVGYFMDPARRVASAAQRGEPTRLEGEPTRTIHVFGSDGGGGRFALGLDDEAIYYLPSMCGVKDGVLLAHETAPVRRVASSVTEFLERLKADIEAFVRGDVTHIYMAQ